MLRRQRTARGPGRLTIGRQLMALTLAVALPLVGAVVYAAAAGRANVGDVARRASHQLALLARSSLDAVVEDIEAELLVLAQRPLVRAVDPDHCDPFLGEFISLNRYALNVAVLDLDGQVVCSVLAPLSEGLADLSGEPWFQDVERTGKLAIGDPDPAADGPLVASFSVPIVDDGERVGYLALPVDVFRFQAVLEGIVEPSEGLVAVVTAAGYLVARSAESERYVGEFLGEDRRKLLGRPYVEVAGIDGVSRIYANVPFEPPGWTVSAGIPLSVTYGDSDRLGRTLVLTAGALLGIALLAAAAIGRRIAAPVQALGARAMALARGEPYVELVPAGPAEVAATAVRLNEMVTAETESTAVRRRLVQQLADTREQEVERRVALLERLAIAEDSERERIAHDIHDDTIQRLAAVNLDLDGLGRRLESRSITPEEVRTRVAEANRALRGATDGVREVVFDLVPPDLDDGLPAALEVLCYRLFEDADTSVVIEGEDPGLDASQARLVYRIAAEALRNVRQHAQAGAVEVRLERNGPSCTLVVTDDGVGLPDGGPSAQPGHIGLRVMAERAAALGGSLSATRGPHGGTLVRVEFEAAPGAGAPSGSGPGSASASPA